MLARQFDTASSVKGLKYLLTEYSIQNTKPISADLNLFPLEKKKWVAGVLAIFDTAHVSDTEAVTIAPGSSRAPEAKYN